MKSRVMVMLSALLLVSVLATAAVAGLASFGPLNTVAAPGNGFPQWYTDVNGVSVDLPIPPIGDGLTAPTMIFAPVTADPYSAQTGFGAEAFYFIAKSPSTFRSVWGNVHRGFRA